MRLITLFVLLLSVFANTTTLTGTGTGTGTRSRIATRTGTTSGTGTFTHTGTRSLMGTSSRTTSGTGTHTDTGTISSSRSATPSRGVVPSRTSSSTGTQTATQTWTQTGTQTQTATGTARGTIAPVQVQQSQTSQDPNFSTIALGSVLGCAVLLAGVAVAVIANNRPKKPFQYVPTIINPIQTNNPLRL